MSLLDFYAVMLFLTFLLQLFLGFKLMASFAQIAQAQADTAAAIAALADRVSNSSGITIAESETILASEQANAAAVAAIP